jgi:hypothetical protein
MVSGPALSPPSAVVHASGLIPESPSDSAATSCWAGESTSDDESARVHTGLMASSVEVAAASATDGLGAPARPAQPADMRASRRATEDTAALFAQKRTAGARKPFTAQMYGKRRSKQRAAVDLLRTSERFLAPRHLSSYDCCVVNRGHIAFCAFWAAACSETASEQQGPLRDAGDDASTDSNSLDARGDGGEAGSGDGGLIFVEPTCPTTPPTCPSLAPSEGVPCAPSGFLCEYGDDPQSACNTLVQCGDAGWVLQKPPTGSVCPTTLPAECPLSYSAALDSGIACPTTVFVCRYPQGTCACEGTPELPTLECGSPPSSNCPATRPRYGSSCSTDSGSCRQWGDPCDFFMNNVSCECGAWQPAGCNPP